MNGTGNGNRITTIALTLLVPPVLGTAIGWVTASNTRMTNHTERIAVIEAQLKDTRDALQHINQKLDKLLDRRP
jgi:hypothetical protein